MQPSGLVAKDPALWPRIHEATLTQIRVDQLGGVHLTAETQAQLDRIEAMLKRLLIGGSDGDA